MHLKEIFLIENKCGQNSLTGISTPNGPDVLLGRWPWTVREKLLYKTIFCFHWNYIRNLTDEL